jgi:hypothetical protein
VPTLALEVAGRVKGSFAPKNSEDELAENNLVAAGVYLVLGVLVGKLPTGVKKWVADHAEV